MPSLQSPYNIFCSAHKQHNKAFLDKVSMTQETSSTRHKLHNNLVKLYDERASSYESELNSVGEVWHLALAQDLVKAAASAIPQSLRFPVRVLDLCCGTGMVSLSANEQFGSSTIIHGIDFSAKSIELANEKAEGLPNLKFFVSSATELDELELEEGSYSLITCCSAFVLLPNGLEALKSWAKYLAPGGILALDVTAVGTQQVTDFMSQSLPAGAATVDRTWIRSAASLTDLLEEAGYVVNDIQLTKIYKTWEYEVSKASEIFDRMLQSEIYRSQVQNRSEFELGEIKSLFVSKMENCAGENGLLIDKTQLYIGVASKRL